MLEFVAGLLTGNALLVVLVVLFLVDVTLFAFEEYIWSVVVMTAVLVGGYFFVGGIHDLVVTVGWRKLLYVYVPIYIGLGVATAFLKWTLLTLRSVSLIKETKKKFELLEAKLKADVAAKVKSGLIPPEVKAELTEEQTAAIAANRRAQFVKFYKDSLPYGKTRNQIQEVDFFKETAVVDALAPRARDNKAMFTLWIYQWPIVLADAVLQDLLVKFAHNVARFIDFATSYYTRKLVANATKGL